MFYQYSDGGVEFYRPAQTILREIDEVSRRIASARARGVKIAAEMGKDKGGILHLCALTHAATELKDELLTLTELLDGLKSELSESLYATGD